MSDNILFEIEAIQKSWSKQKTLQYENLQVVEGEVVILTGKNGAGKTTLLRILAGVIEADDKLKLKWRNVNQECINPGIDATIIHQQPYIFDATVIDNVKQVLSFNKQVTIDAKTILAKAGILKLKDQQARTLSDGEKRRLALTRVYATSAPLVLLDEPSVNLDEKGFELLAEMLSALAKENRSVIASFQESSIPQALVNARKIELKI